MPSSSKKQHNFMAAVANNPAFAKKAGIPQSVGSEFIKADKGKKFAKGGDMKKLPPFMGKETKAEEAKEMKIKAKSKALYDLGEKAEGVHGKSGMKKPTKYAGGGFTKSADGVAQHGKTKAQKFAGGGSSGMADFLSKLKAKRSMMPTMQGKRPATFEQSEELAPMQSAGGVPKRTIQEAQAKMQAMQQQAMQNRRPVGALTSVLRGNIGLPSSAREKMLSDLKGRAPSSVNSDDFRSRATTPATFAQRMSAMKNMAANQPSMTATGPNPVGSAMKKGGCVKKMAKGGGCEVKGKTKGKYI